MQDGDLCHPACEHGCDKASLVISPRFLLSIDGVSWVTGARAIQASNEASPPNPNSPLDKTKAAPEAPLKTRCGRRRRARGWSPYREIYKGNLLSAEQIDWTASVNPHTCTAASIEINYGAAGYFFSLYEQVFAGLLQTRHFSTYRFINHGGQVNSSC
jgi:hypothetical protein